MTTPADLYRNAIDLNRYSNSVAKRIIVSYNDLLVDTAQRLSGLDALSAPAKAAKLRGLLKQLKGSLEDWAANSTALSVKELEELAGVQAGFVEEQLKKAIPPEFRDQIRAVEISPRFAEAVATADPTQQRGVVSLSDDLEAAVTGSKDIKKITMADGVTMTLPNGQVLKKTFANMAEKEAAFFGQAVRNGFLTGEPVESIVRRLKGRLSEGDAGPISQLLRAGGESTTKANNQIRTVIRTSVNQIANAASMKTYEANQDVTKKYRYTATLDSRTSAICRALDGTEHDYGKGPVPPQHFNCRSTTVPIIDYKGLGFDPPPPSKVGRPNSDKNIPDGENYGPWLKRQPKEIQEEVLGNQGQVKYFNALSRKYGPDGAIRRFVREDGSEKTIEDLKKAYGDPSKIKAKQKVSAAEVKAKLAAQQKAAAKKTAAVKDKITDIPNVKLVYDSKLDNPVKQALQNTDIADFLSPDELKRYKKIKEDYYIANGDAIMKKGKEGQIAFAKAKDLKKKKETFEKDYDKAWKAKVKELEAQQKKIKGSLGDDKSYDEDAYYEGLDKLVAKVKPKKGKGRSVNVLKDKTAISKTRSNDSWLRHNADEFKKYGYASEDEMRIARESVRRYTSEFSVRDIREGSFSNSKRLGGKLDSYGNKLAQNARLEGEDDATLINDFLQRAPKYEGQRFRGVNYSDEKVFFDALENYKEGKEVLALESWSDDAGTAIGFAGRGDKIEVVYHVAKSKKSVGISSLNSLGEQEILAPAGSRYRVMGYQKVEDFSGDDLSSITIGKKKPTKTVRYEVELEEI